MTISSIIDKYYGLEPADPFDPNMPDAVRRTRNVKVKAVDELNFIICVAEQLKRTATTIPEENNIDHAERCERWCAAIREADLALHRALSLEYS